MKKLLLELGLVSENSIELFADHTRDRDDVKVYKCKQSGVIFLEDTTHLETDYYQNKEIDNDGKVSESMISGKKVQTKTLQDSLRRQKMFQKYFSNKKWMDVGTATGEVIQLCQAVTNLAVGVEPSAMHRKNMDMQGILAYPNVEEVPNTDFEAVSLFHVLEHLPEPIEILKAIRRKMVAGGKLIVEVPHAKDFLLESLNLDSFKNFTLWSEHLILHTRNSLRVFLQLAGFSNICIQGYQRYSLANHLYWLKNNKPGGHEHWAHCDSDEIARAYQNKLCELDQTDTLIAICDS